MKHAMCETIEAKFDVNTLPQWAKRDPYIIWLCERDLGYRINVQAANFADYKRFLKREARRLFEARHHSDCD